MKFNIKFKHFVVYFFTFVFVLFFANLAIADVGFNTGTEIKVGENIWVDFSITGINNLYGAQTDIQFDDSLLGYMEYQAGSFLDNPPGCSLYRHGAVMRKCCKTLAPIPLTIVIFVSEGPDTDAVTTQPGDVRGDRI